jgi:hypothetical protein
MIKFIIKARCAFSVHQWKLVACWENFIKGTTIHYRYKEGSCSTITIEGDECVHCYARQIRTVRPDRAFVPETYKEAINWSLQRSPRRRRAGNLKVIK